MTDKATVEIPSPITGKVLKRFWQEGQICPVGQALLLIGGAQGGAASSERAESPVVASGAPVSAAPAVAIAQPAAAPQPTGVTRDNGARALAAPATRQLARELGVDIQSVPGTGPHGRVTKADVSAFHAAPVAAAVATVGSPKAAAVAIASQAGDERRPLRGLRRKIAEKMTQSAFTAPHVTTFDEVDMTALVALRARMKGQAEARGLKLSYMPFIMKAVLAALRRFPVFNASLDETTQEIVIKKDVHLGFAAATDNGLMVPVVRHAGSKSVWTLAQEIGAIAERTRQGKATADELSGSSFTISNVGSLGGLFATPIINYPEVAILGVNQIKKRPVERDGAIVLRDMMYLGLSFDHRVADGAEAVQFLNAIIKYLEDPEALLMEF
jgi:pyruvate dehydrogenase E2 component (dihydrolipoamide acetyltransferase)